MFKKSILIGLLMISLLSRADDLVERKSLQAKVTDVAMKKNSQGDTDIYITLEINKEVKSFAFSPFDGENVYFKADLSRLPIQNIKIGQIYNIEMGKFSIPNTNKFSEQIYYLGEKPFSFGELE